LLRAYATIETAGVRQSLVELAEQIAGREAGRTQPRKSRAN
jgi:hypothetical protein